MSEDLTPRQQILLWDLISRGGSALQKDLKPEVRPADREPLVRAKMIFCDPKKRPFKLVIEKAGWDHLVAIAPSLNDVGKTANSDRRVLQFVLAKVQAYVSAHPPLSFAKIFCESKDRKLDDSGEPDKNSVSERGHAPLETAIRSAFFEIAGRPARDGVRLRALRERLASIDRADLDAALLMMRKSGAANLMNLDNPRDIEAEGDAPLKVGHQTFHLLWIDS